MAVEINNQLREGDYKKILELLSRNMKTGYVNVELLNEYMRDPVNILEMGFSSYSPNELMLKSAAFSADGINPNVMGDKILSSFVKELLDDYKITERKSGDPNYKFTVNGDGVKNDVYSGFKNAFFTVSSYESIPADISPMESEVLFMKNVLEKGFNALYKTYGIEPEIEIDLKFGKSYSTPESPATIKIFQKTKKNSITNPEKLYPLFIDIGGCEKAKEELILLSDGLKYPGLFEKWGIRFPKGIMLYGPPGTGKTMLAKAMANQAGVNIYQIEGSDIHAKWYGDSEKNMAAVFDEAKKMAPSIILIDEIDGVAPHREGSHEVTKRVVSTMLQKMDGIDSSDGVTVIGTTNYIENVDPAILRSGRFDELIKIDIPEEDHRARIYELHCHEKRVADIDYRELAKRSEGLSGADIETVVRISLKKKLKRERETNEEQPPVCTSDLLDSLIEYGKMRNNLPGNLKDHSYMYI